MKQYYLFIGLLCICSVGISQKYADIGLIGGVSYYLGDINPTLHFSNISPGYGAIYRYSLNYHHSFRAIVFYNTLKSGGTNQPWYSSDYPSTTSGFSSTFIDGALNYEFNFLKYRTTDIKYTFSPYLTFGVGYNYYLSSTTTVTSHITFPYGIGAKVNITERLSAGLEWIIRKTLTDNIDGITNITVSNSKKPIFNNNDWYTFTGLFITYKFFKFADKCPTYFN